MKILWNILVAILLLMLILIGVGLLLPQQVKIQRNQLIKAEPEIIFEQVSQLSNWEKWSPWFKTGPEMKILFSGPVKGKNTILNWKSTKPELGNGSVIIIKSVSYDTLAVELDFGKNGKSSGIFTLQKVDSGTLVSFILENNLGLNPVTRIFGSVMDRMVGPDLEKGLSNLKKIAESIQPPKNVHISISQIPEFFAVTIRDTCSPVNLNSCLKAIYQHLTSICQQHQLTVSGCPFIIYHSFSPELFEIEAGIPVEKPVSEKLSHINFAIFPAADAVKASYKGEYKSITIAYNALYKYVNDLNYSILGPPMEVYLTNPISNPDSMAWETEIYLPIEELK